jgi:hypothetical protein
MKAAEDKITLSESSLRDVFKTYPGRPRHYNMTFLHSGIPTWQDLPPSEVVTYLTICKSYGVLPFCSEDWKYNEQIGVFTPSERKYEIPSLSGVASQLYEIISMHPHIPIIRKIPHNCGGVSQDEFNRFRTEFLDTMLAHYDLQHASMVVSTDREYAGTTLHLQKSTDGYSVKLYPYDYHKQVNEQMREWMKELEKTD